jgi:hypothetical protein
VCTSVTGPDGRAGASAGEGLPYAVDPALLSERDVLDVVGDRPGVGRGPENRLCGRWFADHFQEPRARGRDVQYQVPNKTQ